MRGRCWRRSDSRSCRFRSRTAANPPEETFAEPMTSAQRPAGPDPLRPSKAIRSCAASGSPAALMACDKPAFRKSEGGHFGGRRESLAIRGEE
jgi:hypothetical protein